jgi:lysophospholipase L1-like esterase
VASNALTQFILGGKTQVQRALEARPTFASIWIGNQDVLVAGLTGLLTNTPPFSPGIVSTPAQYQANFDQIIKQLTDSAPNLKGVIVGVVQVAGVPAMSSAALIASTPAVQIAINTFTGKTVIIAPSCIGSTALIDLALLLPQIKAGTYPPLIACDKTGLPFPVGDLFVLDQAEQVVLAATINAYNTYLQQKAAAIGWAYYDPNPLFAAKRASGEIPPIPNFTSGTQTFGPLFSLDGVHPSGQAHLLIANELIATINTKFGTKLPPQ